VEDVRVQVDEAGRDVLPVRVDDAKCSLRWNRAVDGGDPVAVDRDVEAALAPAARIDDLAAPDQQVEAHQLLAIAPRIQSSASSRTNP
jgi:hypothetical protein